MLFRTRQTTLERNSLEKQHSYNATITWTGNQGGGTSDYKAYSRDYDVVIEGKPVLSGSADPAFRGDAGRHNPEDLLLASLSACHMLWYLHLCAVNKVVVTAYEDSAEGAMAMNPDGSGQFTAVTLRPRVTITAESDRDRALELHKKAHEMCFIARSMNFPVGHEPEILPG